MLGNALISIYWFLSFLLISALPSSTGFPIEVQQAFSAVSGYLKLMDHFIDLEALAVVVTSYLALEIVIFVFNSSRFFINVFRGGSA